MPYTTYFLVGIFLPLFPFSMLFNGLHTKIRHPLLRSLLMLVWPQVGIVLLNALSVDVPDWIVFWSLFTALMYALRALALRELGLWTSFVGTSAWALLWILSVNDTNTIQLHLFALGISVPLVLMTQLNAGLERRFGGAYLGLYGGLAQSIPRFTGVLVVVVLAIVATPLFPTFFAMLSMILNTIPASPMLAAGIGVVWLLWSWAGARLLQGLIVGPQNSTVADLSKVKMWSYVVVLAVLIVASVFYLGGRYEN